MFFDGDSVKLFCLKGVFFFKLKKNDGLSLYGAKLVKILHNVVVQEKCYLHDKKQEGKKPDNGFRKLQRGMFSQDP